jgi:hypothetical protein
VALQTSGTTNLSVNRDGQALITRSWSKSNAIVGQTRVTAEVAATIQTSINEKKENSQGNCGTDISMFYSYFLIVK